MTITERRMWARWLTRKYRCRPRTFFLSSDCGYAYRSRRYEMHGLLMDFAEAYFFMRNRRLGMPVREARLNCRWGDVKDFLRFPSTEWSKNYGG